MASSNGKAKRRQPSGVLPNSVDEQLAPLTALFIPSVLDQNDPEGLLPTGSQLSDLRAYIEEIWENEAIEPYETDIVRLYWGRTAEAMKPFDTLFFDGPVLPSMFPFPVNAPRSNFQGDGAYYVWYTVELDNGARATADPKKITVDTVAPSYDKQPGALLYPDDLPNKVIDEAYLSTHGDRVRLRLPTPIYTGAEDRDTLIFWWSDSPSPTDLWLVQKAISIDDINAEDIWVDLTGDMIRAPNKNGTFYALYKLRDRAGNETLVFSEPASAVVSLLPFPSILPPPRVPLHEDDNLVHRGDARAQVNAVISGLDNLEPNDKVRLDWDGSQLLPVPITLPDTVIPVPWSALIAKGPGPMVAHVSYDFIRDITETGSQVADINVNFTVAGQDHPGAPALLNPLLALVDIIGGSGTPNVLLPADRAAPVVPYLMLYQTPAAGEVLELYWGRVAGPVARYDVQPGDLEGDRVAFTPVPWSVIDADSNNARVPVYYTTSNAVNEQQSDNQYVRVQVVTIDDLPEPGFEDEDAFGYIQCDKKPWEGIRVRVKFDSGHFGLDDEIMVFWQGYRNFNSTDPITETYGEFPETIGPGHLQDGYIDVWIRPYEPYIKPVTRGSWGTYYTLTKADGQFGTSPAPENLKIIETVSPEMCPPA